jgi:hypothetical protein
MNKEALAKTGQERINIYREAIDTVYNLPDEVMDEVVGGFISDGTVFLYLPFDMPTYRKVRRMLNAEGWEAFSVYTNDSTRNTKLKNESKIHLNLDMDMDRKGSTCKKVLVGEKKITRTVQEYKITCN